MKKEGKRVYRRSETEIREKDPMIEISIGIKGRQE